VFNKVMDAFGLPKGSDEEKKARTAAIQEATKHASEIPLKVMETAAKSYELLSEMADNGNPASVSDVGVGALATRACIEGAAMNVRINLCQLKDKRFSRRLQKRLQKVSADSEASFRKINRMVKRKLG
jgi:glutamate formiminotransferase/formiminotetrahydrofolate cyclodeaminase